MSIKEGLQAQFGNLGVSLRGSDQEDTPAETAEDTADEVGAEAEPEDLDLEDGSGEDTEEVEDSPVDESGGESEGSDGISPEEKAKLLDRLMSDEQFRAAFMASMGDKSQNQPTEQHRDALSFNPFEGVKPEEVLEDDAIPAVKALVWNVMQEYLFPDLQQYKQVIVELAKGHQESRFTGLESKYPDAASKRQEIAALVQANPNLSLEQAYFAVAGPSASAPTSTPKKKRKKRVSLTKGASTPPSKVRTTGKQSMAEIVEEQLSKLGLA